ncbi:hypothetical protein OC846_003431 [Tilletia horrida]|uniref:Bacteriophage T5 Orf172 DNA-binding domain-containing protein n=1 Tax=Tilletia horrida TaxID=155126 RepID=A0AAN6JRB8_9BASI|nr:hypothetical protein OC846_003431 [Tilletia horrida]
MVEATLAPRVLAGQWDCAKLFLAPFPANAGVSSEMEPGSSPSVQKKSPHSRRVAGASRGRPIILSSDSEEEDDDDNDDSWIVHDSSDDAEYRIGNRSSAQRRTERSLASASNLLLPPETEGRRRHRRSRSAGAEQPPLLDHARLGPNSRSHSDNGHWLDVESFTSTDDDEERGGRGSSSRTGQGLVEPAYCFQHISEINKSPGFYISRNHHQHSRADGQRHSPSSVTDDYVAFVEYLRGPSGALLGQQAQASLRSVMSAALTAADVRGLESAGRNGRGSPQGQPSSRGYMYIYELRAFSTSTEVCLKVGRTSNVFRRMAEWKGRCRRRGAGLVLIGFEPSPQSNDRTSSAVSPARGRPTGGGVEAPAQGLIGGAAEVWCEGIYGSHKWERLTHLELLDIGRRLDEGPCEDCGARHREIFMIPRDIGQGNTNAIEAVREIVRKWEGFVRRLVGEA